MYLQTDSQSVHNVIYESHIPLISAPLISAPLISAPLISAPLIEDLSCYDIRVKATCNGSLQIATTPSGADIYIYEEIQGDYVFTGAQTGTMISPSIINDIECTGPTRSNKFKLTLPGYVDVEGWLDITDGNIYQLYIIMEKCTTPGISEAGGWLLPALAIGSLFFLLSGGEERKRKKLDYEKYKEIYE